MDQGGGAARPPPAKDVRDSKHAPALQDGLGSATGATALVGGGAQTAADANTQGALPFESDRSSLGASSAGVNAPVLKSNTSGAAWPEQSVKLMNCPARCGALSM